MTLTRALSLTLTTALLLALLAACGDEPSRTDTNADPDTKSTTTGDEKAGDEQPAGDEKAGDEKAGDEKAGDAGTEQAAALPILRYYAFAG